MVNIMNKRIALLVLTLLILGGVAFAYQATSRETFQAGSAGGQLSEEDVAALVEAVSRHIVLPDEEPLIATIANADLLIEQEPFYQGAKNGDFLLLYPNAGKAILYDQESDVLVNVGPIVLDESAGTQAPTELTTDETPSEPAPEEPVTIE